MHPLEYSFIFFIILLPLCGFVYYLMLPRIISKRAMVAEKEFKDWGKAQDGNVCSLKKNNLGRVMFGWDMIRMPKYTGVWIDSQSKEHTATFEPELWGTVQFMKEI